MGKLWGVYYENFEENWLLYNGIALYLTVIYQESLPLQTPHSFLLMARNGVFVESSMLSISSLADSRLVPSQWETSLQCNAVVTHWLDANLESSLSLLYSVQNDIILGPCYNKIQLHMIRGRIQSLPSSVLEIPTGLPVRGRPLWRKNFCWLSFNFKFMIWDSSHEDRQLFWLSFQHWPSLCGFRTILPVW